MTKFADRYEILGAIPSGRVETFVARDSMTGEQVLLHIFESAEPASPGIAEAKGRPASGKPQDTRSVSYSVTNRNTLETWQGVAGSTPGLAETRASLPEDPARGQKRTPVPTPAEMPSSRSVSLSAPQDRPGEFTEKFFALSKENHQEAPGSEASGFFFSGLGTSPLGEPAAEGIKSGPAWNEEQTPSRSALNEFGFERAAEARVTPAGIEPSKRPGSGQAENGSFTDFFRGPFDGGTPGDVPAYPLQAGAKPASKPPGEFTSIFGKDDRAAGNVGPLVDHAAASVDPARAKPRAPVVNPIPDDAPFASSLSRNSFAPLPTPLAADSQARRPVDRSEPFSGAKASSQRATGIFTPERAPAPVERVTGEASEYTRIISAGERPREEAAAAVEVQPEPAAFKAPAAPKMPPVKPLTAPKIPAAAQSAGKGATKTSPLALVLIFSNLLLLAVLLIVYFTLRR